MFNASLGESKISPKIILLLIVIAYFFSVGVRFIWTDWAGTDPQNFHNNEIMISTNDGYAYAEGARDILRGGNDEGDGSFIDKPLSKFTALLAQILPIPFETLILYMPGFVASLIVIPLILLGRTLNMTLVGFLSALFAGIAWSYYNRTMFGYYDTDMLTIVLPMFVLYFMVLAFTQHKNRYLLGLTFSMLIYQWYYPASRSLNFAFFAISLAIIVVLPLAKLKIFSFIQKAFSLNTNQTEKERFEYKIPLFMVIAIIPTLSLEIKFLLTLLLFSYFHFTQTKSQQYQLPLLIIFSLLYFILGGLEPVLTALKSYVFREQVSATQNALNFHYFNVVQTVREASAIPFDIFAKRISGHPISFFLSILGLAILLWRKPIMLLSIPMIGLGFMAYSSGLRFTVYALPIFAFGLSYLIISLSMFAQQLIVRLILIIIATSAVLYPNIQHIQGYLVPTVFQKSEVETLVKLNTISSGQDYAIAWWDYGFPLRYYSDVKTLSDGARHSGDLNFPVSFILSEQLSYATGNMLRNTVEALELQKNQQNQHKGSLFEIAMQELNYQQPYEFIKAMQSNQFKNLPKTRDAYLILPLRMQGIFPTVRLFSNLDITTGQKFPRPLYYFTQFFKETGDILDLGQGVIVLKNKGVFRIGNQEVPLKEIIVAQKNERGLMEHKRVPINSSSQYTLVYIPEYRGMLLADQATLNSTYVQMFFLEQYIPEHFEPVIMDSRIKIYKLKI